MTDEEEIVMTAVKKNGRAMMRLERKKRSDINFKKVHHVAGGPYKGILINKIAETLDNVQPAEARMELLAYLIDQDAGNANIQDYWILRFWFQGHTDGVTKKKTFTDYFAELISPNNMPKNYCGFVKRALVLLQKYKLIKRVELEIEETDEPTLDSSRCPITSFTTVFTPASYTYQFVPEVPVNDKTFLAFKIKAAAEAHIALSAVYGDVDRKTYEIVLGTDSNTKSVIRDGSLGQVKAETPTVNLLSEREFRFFWISWKNNHVEVGKGCEYGFGRFLHWQVPANRRFNVNCLAVATSRLSKGEWEFAEIVEEEPPKDRVIQEIAERLGPHAVLGSLRRQVEDPEKRARRERIRSSLLWLAKKQKMLQCLEEAYPNSMPIGDLLRTCRVKQTDALTAMVMLREMAKRGLIRELTEGMWMRIQAEEAAPVSGVDSARIKHEVKLVKEMPTLSGKEQPTIGIVTGLYCEKLAVDAMMENKTTFVKYKTEGESQVYTVGYIGRHRVVSTKVSRMEGNRGGKIAAENTVTRLLGTFSRIEHMLLVGVGGAVPHYSDYTKHVRLGDVVVSTPVDSSGAMYIHCSKVEKIAGRGGYSYITRAYASRDQTLLSAVKSLRAKAEARPADRKSWELYIEEGKDILKAQESNFHRPHIKTDKLFFTKPDGTVVQCDHPRPPGTAPGTWQEGNTSVAYGVVASGRIVARAEDLRRDFAQLNGVRTFDSEYDAVLDSMEGNRNDSFLIIRGMADYVDGSKKEWQPYASLVAAAYMKAVIMHL